LLEQPTATLVVLPYVKNVFLKKLQRPLKTHNIQVAHRPMKRLANIFPRPKDRLDKRDKEIYTDILANHQTPSLHEDYVDVNDVTDYD